MSKKLHRLEILLSDSNKKHDAEKKNQLSDMITFLEQETSDLLKTIGGK